LLRGLQAGFASVEDEAAFLMREHTSTDWGYTQTAYRMLMDHSGMLRCEIPVEVARATLARSLGFLRDKLLADLASGKKLFVYRTYDHTTDERLQVALADAVSQYGKGVFFYAQEADPDHPAFTVVRKASNLIVGYIDHFAPQGGQLIYNSSGWEAVCRAALEAWETPVEDNVGPDQGYLASEAPGLSAMDYLRRNPAPIMPHPVRQPTRGNLFGLLRRWIARI
jgi:hypothetical protein